MMANKTKVFFAATISIMCCGCNGDRTVSPEPTGADVMRMEKFCSIPDLNKPLRQTFILIDQKMLAKAMTPKDFNDKNSRVRDTVLAFTDPSRSVEYGKSSARERITLLLASANGATPRKIFTGCLPSLSSEERQQASKKESSILKFFTGGSEQELNEASAKFRSRIIASLLNEANNISTDELTNSMVLQSMAAATSIYKESNTVPRIVVISDHLSGEIPNDIKLARIKGFRFGSELGAQLGNAEILVVGDGSQSENARAYLSSAFLAMGANLLSWSQDSDSLSTSPVPTKLIRFSGETYVSGTPYRELINVRIALDKNNNLINSWIIFPGSTQSTPMTGGGICRSDGTCDLRSDSGPFAQVWITEQSAKPTFDDTAPFGGMRSWNLSIKKDKLVGRVFDASIDRVIAQGQDHFKVEANLIQNADF